MEDKRSWYNMTLPLVTGRGKTAALPILEIHGKNPFHSRKGTWDKLFIESYFYNTTKQSILKSFNGSAANLQIPGVNTVNNRPFATNDHVVQNPQCWRASSLLFPHWVIKTKASQASLVQVSLVWCPGAGIIISSPSSMADFVPCDCFLQKA